MAGFEHGIVYGMVYGAMRAAGFDPRHCAVEALREADEAMAHKERLRPSYSADPVATPTAPKAPRQSEASTPMDPTLPVPVGSSPLPGQIKELRDMIGQWSPKEIEAFAGELVDAATKKG